MSETARADALPRAANAVRSRVREGSPRRTAVAIAVAAVLAAMLVYGEVLRGMVLHWRAVPDYSHGFLVAPLALYLAWERRRELRAAPIEGSWWGVLPLALGVLALAIGRLGVELTAMRSAFVWTVIGLVLLLLGRSVARILAFPLCFLFLMVPLPQSLVNAVTFPLQLVAAHLAAVALQGLGVPVLVEGNLIHLADARLFIAEACSGLRSLMALLTLGVVFAHFFCARTFDRIAVVLATLPIAILVNALRVALSGWLAQRFGADAAGGPIHDFQGVITFVSAFLLLLLLARALAACRALGPRT